MDDTGLIAGLTRPEAYPFPARSIQVIETHISWVILTGTVAYKIKKPVNFGFLDFTSLEARHRFCLEEVRVNRRLADSLYLDCVPITGSPAQPHMEGTGIPIEYAVRMRQFDSDCLFDTLATTGQLGIPVLERLADRLATFHQGLTPAEPDTVYGSADIIHQAAMDNFSLLAQYPMDAEDQAALHTLARWSEQTGQALRPIFQDRKRLGFIRECHGDLHLGNIVLLDGEPTPFDAIEFNAHFRWIDLMNELAFLVTDLEIHGLETQAMHVLNRYLEKTGDQAGLQVFTYYRLYRAMVRAKISRLSRDPATETAEQKAQALARLRTYLTYGLNLIQPVPPRLFLTHGYSGSGKSRLAAQLAERTHAICLRSDVERKRLHALTDTHLERYDPAFTERTYRYLLDLTCTLLRAGFSVVVDATFLDSTHRRQQQELARELGLEWFLFSCTASSALLRQRIQQRALEGRDPSEASVAVLERQIASHHPLTDDEYAHQIVIDCTTPESMLACLENHLPGRQSSSKYAN